VSIFAATLVALYLASTRHSLPVNRRGCSASWITRDFPVAGTYTLFGLGVPRGACVTLIGSCGVSRSRASCQDVGLLRHPILSRPSM
jgi:hypothetical protein